MAEPHVVVTLCRKRAELSGYIAELERKIARERFSLPVAMIRYLA